MSATKTRKPRPKANGQAPAEQSEIAAAIAYEEQVRQDAEAIWTRDENADSAVITPLLFRELRPLLRRPIPAGFIETVGKVEGKPYPSTGVRSAQVQMDRLDNVLGPTNWGYRAEYSDDGKRCYVRAWVGDEESPLFARDSWGGVNRGSTEGNIWKGSFTNAAKPALARLGPGWEVYVGAADFDPDTDRSAAEAQKSSPAEGEKQPAEKLSTERAENLKAIIETAGLTEHLSAKLRGFGVKELTELTVEQGMKIWEWVQASAEPAK